MNLGFEVRELVLGLAGLLRNEAAPGWVTLALLVLLLYVSWRFLRLTSQRIASVRRLHGLVKAASTTADFHEIAQKVTVGSRRSDPSRSQLADTWREYMDTLIDQEVDGENIIRNTIRPIFFFNADDLGFGPGFSRYIPGLFVSVGLFLTFLGLIAALGRMNLTDGNATASLNELLTIASAKFIMSLTGLACSIIFTIVMRWRSATVENALHQLCHDLEMRLSYVSLEELAIEQLRATREQRDQWRELGYELVAELGRPLREELPRAISASIRGEMAPLIDQVSKMGSDGMGTMVADLSDRFSRDVSRALGAASDRLAEAGAKIGELAGRLDQSSGRMGTEMEHAVARLGQAIDDLRSSMGAAAATTASALTQGGEQLLAAMNETLQGIRDNTGDGARAMSAAAAEMREAALGFRAELESASASGAAAARESLVAASADVGTEITKAFGRTAEEIVARAGDLSSTIGRDLIEPVDAIAQRIQDVVAELAGGTMEMRRLSDSIRSGAEAGETAAGAFRTASQALTEAATPVRQSVERIDESLRGLSASVETASSTVSRSAEQTARSAAGTLEAASAAIGGERKAIEAALGGVARVLEAQKGQGDRLDEMDEKLGAAFEKYREQVEGTIVAIGGYVREMTGEMNTALDVMRGVLEQAEEFQPQQARRA
ncbi:hypothetical protein [Amaricoccus solimangrovi]|nr:hypothetical protein [Amaricoccus solimangrovi]